MWLHGLLEPLKLKVASNSTDPFIEDGRLEVRVLGSNKAISETKSGGIGSPLDHRIVVQAKHPDKGIRAFAQALYESYVIIQSRLPTQKQVRKCGRHRVPVRCILGTALIEQIQCVFKTCSSAVQLRLNRCSMGLIGEAILDQTPEFKRQRVTGTIQI